MPDIILNHARNFPCMPCLFICLLTGCIPSQHTIHGEKYSVDRLQIEEHTAKRQCLENSKASTIPAQTFTTDGCSFWFDYEWQECCVEHDKAYWCGGTVAQRKQADNELMQCVSGQGYPLIAKIMQIGVVVGGHPWLPMPWRWGYGRKWPSTYDEAEQP